VAHERFEKGTNVTLTYEHKVHKALQAGRMLRGWTQAQMAELMADATGEDGWNADRITAIENGRRKVDPVELRTFAEIQEFDIEFYWYGPPVNRRVVRHGPRDFGSAIPGLHNRDTLRDRLSRRILNSDRTESFHCFDCLLDPDFHVLAEWLAPAGQIPGQTEFIIDIEKMLEDVA